VPLSTRLKTLFALPPLICALSPAYTANTRRRFLERFPYSVIYREKEEVLLVVGGAHRPSAARALEGESEPGNGRAAISSDSALPISPLARTAAQLLEDARKLPPGDRDWLVRRLVHEIRRAVRRNRMRSGNRRSRQRLDENRFRSGQDSTPQTRSSPMDERVLPNGANEAGLCPSCCGGRGG